MNNNGVTNPPAADTSSHPAIPAVNSSTASNGGQNVVANNATSVNTGNSGSGGQPILPTVSGTCPTLNPGMVTFQINGVSIEVRVYRDASVTQKGPFVFYWHGTLSFPLEPIATLGANFIANLNKEGGIILAPQGPTGLGGTMLSGTAVWYSNDLILADQMLACALQQGLVDPKRIVVTGLSAGGIMTTQMSYLRSNYVASVASISGGLIDWTGAPPSQNPSNKFSAMAIHGGPTDNVFESFQTAETAFYNDLKGKGQYALLCNHGQGHAVALPNDLDDAILTFFNANTFGQAPWQGGALPAGIPSYCAP